jgi:YCII-related domain
MNTYLLVHRHPHNYVGSPDTPAAWEAWFKELGDALVDLGNPVLGDRSTAGEAGTVLPLGGYTIIDADNLEEATRLASGCPIIQDGGAVEVGRLTPVPGRQHPARTF